MKPAAGGIDGPPGQVRCDPLDAAVAVCDLQEHRLESPDAVTSVERAQLGEPEGLHDVIRDVQLQSGRAGGEFDLEPVLSVIEYGSCRLDVGYTARVEKSRQQLQEPKCDADAQITSVSVYIPLFVGFGKEHERRVPDHQVEGVLRRADLKDVSFVNVAV